MRNQKLKRIQDLLFPAVPEAPSAHRPGHERFPLPHLFKPRLSLYEAFVATCGALLRIVFGSLLFAVWGTYTLMAWTTIRNYFWRAAVVLPMLVLFLLLLVLLLTSISALVRFILSKR